jgi:hypothetical protein
MNDDTKHTPGGPQADSEADKRIKEAQMAGAGNAGSATPKGYPSDDRHTTEHKVGGTSPKGG